MSAPKAFVVGWPITHSRSPKIHRFWLERHGIAGDYVAEAVPPETIDAFLAGFAAEGYVGGNVTVPHKESAFRAASVRSPVAERLEAANTLWLADGKLHADNTDAYGFAANLDAAAPEWRAGTDALVIGAGGAARAVILAFLDAGYASVTVVNRTPGRAETLARKFGARVSAAGVDALADALANADVVVNATSAGLHGEGLPEIDWTQAKPRALVTDLTYVPLMTPFLTEAAAGGLTTIDGLGMLLYQAVPGFERWFGVRPVVDAALRAAIVADIGG
jgi:shikimate dehydrogenase